MLVPEPSESQVGFFVGCQSEAVGDEEQFNTLQFYEATQVNFATISPETIRAYIETGESM